ncbi:MAG: peptidylprolyl isomerase [Candidatus Cloacimonetes bacterium]|nr:peptidylprolyl isomerase [Candidatus Cloacimonadota bacterium]
MKKSSKILTIVLIIVAAFLIIFNNLIKTGSNKILAKINEEIIYSSDLQKESEQFGPNLSKNDKKLLLQELINRNIAMIYAENNSFFDDTQNRKDFDWLKNEAKRELLINTMFEEKLNKNITMSDEDYKAFIKGHPYIKIMKIVIPIQQKADDSSKAKEKIYKAYEKLDSGEDFEKVRNKYMKKIYRGVNNLPEIVKIEDIKSLFPTNSFNLKVGEYTKPILTSVGYIIIKRFDDPLFDEIKIEAENDLKSQKESIYLNNYLNDFRSGLSIYENNLKKALFPKNLSQAQDDDILIAVYNNYTLKYNKIKRYLSYFLTQEQIKMMDIQQIIEIIKQIALQEFLYQTAIKENYDTTATFVSQWDVQEQEFSKKWDDFIINKVYKDVISPDIIVEDDEIDEYYQNNIDEFYENGKLKPLSEVKQLINMKLKKDKLALWYEKAVKNYNIKIEKYEKNI